jgi:hypothetical protein
VGFRDALFGRKQLKQPQADRLFALSTAQVTLEVELGLRSAGAAAVCFKPLSAGEFMRAERELAELLDLAAHESHSQVEHRTDDLGFEWVVIRDPHIEDLVTTVHLVSSDLIARGFGAQLLAAMFRFESRGEPAPVFLLYGYKRGAFYPFVPTGKDKRDNARELELKAKLEAELPIEDDLERWFGLWDAPI